MMIPTDFHSFLRAQPLDLASRCVSVVATHPGAGLWLHEAANQYGLFQAGLLDLDISFSRENMMIISDFD
jgi:hypothetical protein